MDIEISIGKIYKAYNLISVCKLTKMSDEGKIKIWKILKTLKPVSDKFNNEIQIAVDKFKPFSDYDSKLEKCKKYEDMVSKNVTEELPVTEEEYKSFMVEYIKYNDLVNKAIDDYSENTYVLDVNLLSEEEYENLITSNDWDASDVLFLGEIITQ